MTMAKLGAEAGAQLLEGISLVLSRWDALLFAVEGQWGGPHSLANAQQFPSHLFSLLTRSTEKLYIDEVEDFINNYMWKSMGGGAEDGSIEEIAEKLMIMHEECLEGNYDSIKRLREAAPHRRAPAYIIQDDDDDDDYEDNNVTDEMILSNGESSAMVVDAPETSSRHSQVDMIDSPPTDAGWTVVGRSRRNRGITN